MSVHLWKQNVPASNAANFCIEKNTCIFLQCIVKWYQFGGNVQMRKKSHISLAKYLVYNLGNEELNKHRFSFYIGSILPDIKPSFLYRRHEMSGTYEDIKRHIIRLTEGEKIVGKKKCGIKYFMDLGQISHYLADYFTLPHNCVYAGNLKEHCQYEEELKINLRKYVKEEAAKRHGNARMHVKNAEQLCRLIRQMHEDYLVTNHNVQNDIFHIVEINHKAVLAMLELLASQKKIFAPAV